MNVSPSYSDLTAIDRAILEEVREYWDGITGRDLAPAVGVPARAIGSRLTALRKRGLLRGERYAGMVTWFATEAGEEMLN